MRKIKVSRNEQRRDWNRFIALGMCVLSVQMSPAMGAERKFAVMLANSPKEFPNSEELGSNEGQPVEGQVSFQEVYNRYFGPVTGSGCYSEVGDFASFWEEISYGDVTIAGQVFDWVQLPWAIQPQLRDPADDQGSAADGGTDLCGEEVWTRTAPDYDSTADRNSPVCYTDLTEALPGDPENPDADPDENGCPFDGEAGDSRLYGYGAGEKFTEAQAAIIIDVDGDPMNQDNGPVVPGPGFSDVTSDYLDILGAPYAGDIFASANAVFTPGERFIDIDNDDRWDGLDESSNMMDFTVPPDGLVDLAGPWVDLNGDQQADNEKVWEGCPGVIYPDVCTYMDDVEPRFMSCTNRLIDDGSGNMVGDPTFGLYCESDADCGDVAGSCQNTVPFHRGFEPDRDGDFVPDCYDGIPDCAENSDGSPITDPADRINHCPITLNDCNGNLQDDAIDILTGVSEDVLDWACLEIPPPEELCPPDGTGDAESCCPLTPEGLPDSTNENCDECGEDTVPDECQDPTHPDYNGLTEDTITEFPVRCEYHDINCNDTMDVPEPYEDFLRRWDSCRDDPDASNPTGQRWLKIYDPYSASVAVCNGNAPPEMKDPTFTYNDPSYIFFNYPGNTTELMKRAGNGMYDPSDGWTELGNTKLQWQDGPAFFTATPEPGTVELVAPAEEAWYEQAWEDRYLNFTGMAFVDTSCDPATEPCAPIWPTGDQDPAPPNNNPALLNTPAMQPYDPEENNGSDVVEGRRYFQANRGGLWGDGSGWLSGVEPAGGPGNNIFVPFETNVGNNFEDDDSGGCPNCRIMPEEMNGIPDQGELTIMYDGWVEHDDLPSSKYHMNGSNFPFGAGDQAMGEVTSSTSDSIAGEDRGDNDPNTPDLDGDNFTIAAGPYAINVDSNRGRDGGNVLLLEWLTWRTDGTFPSYGFGWEVVNGTAHPFAGFGGATPNMNFGFRDYNLDGLVDQGEVRRPGSENYIVDPSQSSPDNGTNSQYPFNRQRLLEDCVAALDAETGFDKWEDANSMNAVTGGAPVCFDIDFENWVDEDGDGIPDPNGCIEFIDGEPSGDLFARGFVSGIVLLPPHAWTAPGESGEGGSVFPFSPSFYPIHNEDEDDLNDVYPFVGQLNYNLWFHDLVTFIDYNPTGATRTASGNLFVEAYSAHEYGHAWEGWPDLYDYDVLGGGGLINFPIGFWCLMTNHGSIVHPIPAFKENSTFIDPVDLATVLTPGVPQEVTIVACENFREESYFYFENPTPEVPGGRERFYFWHQEFKFDEPKFFDTGELVSWVGGTPGPGMMIMYADLGSDDERVPQQQISGTAATYMIVAADGLNEGPGGVDPGDWGDPWPGETDNRGPWDDDSVPNNRWDEFRPSGIEIESLIPVAGGTRVTFVWNPTDVPTLEFTTPPGGASVDGIYQIRYTANDQYGGTDIELYYTDDPTSYAGTLIGTATKAPGLIDDSFDWDISGVPDGNYTFYAKLIPGAGENGQTEPAYSVVRSGRNNFGDGTLTIVGADSATAKLESWTIELVTDEDSNAVWQVEGSLSGVQTNVLTPGTTYNTDDGEVTFDLTQGGIPFAVGDRFVFVTTGLTAMSATVIVDDGEITEAPHAVIRVLDDFLPDGVDVIPAGPAPLTLYFDAQESTDPNGQTLTYTWDFGDGAGASGPSVSHTFTDSGSFTVTLTATNPLGALDEAQVDVEVINQAPTAKIIANPTSTSETSVTVQFDASSSKDVEDSTNELTFDWNFGDCPDPGCIIEDGDTNVSHFYSTSNPPETFLASVTVTDSGGASSTASVLIMLGNSNPIAVISPSATTLEVNEVVTLSGELSTDPDSEDNPLTDFTWNFGDGSAEATGESVTHSYSAVGTYTVTLTVKDGRGGIGTGTVNLNVVEEGELPGSGPDAGFIVSPATTVDLGTIMTFTSTSTPANEIVSWEWDFDDGTTATGTEVSHTYLEAGTYTVELLVTDENDDTSLATQSVTIVAPPPTNDNTGEEVNLFDPVAEFSAIPTAGRAPLVVAFDGSDSTDPDEAGALTYAWTFGDGGTATGALVSHTYNNPGSYTAVLTVTDVGGRTDTASRLITVTGDPTTGEPPVARVTTGLRTGVTPFVVALDGNLSSGSGLSFEWSIEGGSVDDTMTGAVINYTFTEPGTYTVTLTVTDSEGMTDVADPITITVAESTTPPPANDNTEPAPTTPIRDTGSTGRPSSLCGAGMLMNSLVSALGLMAMMMGRSRRRRIELELE